MSMPQNSSKLQRRATKILKECGIDEPPVDLFHVAAVLGAEVRPEFADDDVSGALYRLEEGTVIGVNARHHANRVRFTIAHEIGHLLLHDEKVFVDRRYSPSRGDQARFLRSSLSAEATDQREIDANQFAACLLMPKNFIAKDVGGLPLPLRREDVLQLASQYEVSSQAMTFRLLNLQVPVEEV